MESLMVTTFSCIYTVTQTMEGRSLITKYKSNFDWFKQSTRKPKEININVFYLSKGFAYNKQMIQVMTTLIGIYYTHVCSSVYICVDILLSDPWYLNSNLSKVDLSRRRTQCSASLENACKPYQGFTKALWVKLDRQNFSEAVDGCAKSEDTSHRDRGF